LGKFSWIKIGYGVLTEFQGLKVGFLEFDLKKKSASIWDSGDAKVSSTNLSTIGLALVNLLGPSVVTETANKYVYVASHTVSQNQILKAFEKVSGESWSVSKKSSEEIIPQSLEKIKNHDYSVVVSLIQAAAFGNAAYGDFEKVHGGVWNDKLGLPKEDFEADVKAVFEGKRP
jgi:hypothetical protein